MARKASNVRLQTKEARRALRPQLEPYWHELRRGLALGYRQGTTGGTWRLREYRDGKLHKRRLGLADSDRLAADGETVLTWQQALKLALGDERPTTQPRGDYTVTQALADYFEHRAAKSPSLSLAIDRSKATHQIERDLGSLTVASLTSAKLRQWRDALIPMTDDPEERRRAQATANRLWTILRAALNFAYQNGHAANAESWRRIKPFANVDRAGERFLSRAECTRLLNACEPSFRALVRAALNTGCRLGELMRLTAADVADTEVIIRHSKSGKSRRVQLSDEGAKFFDLLTTGREGRELLLPAPEGRVWSHMQVSRAMREAVAAARIEPVATFRDLRRSYGSLLINAGTSGDVIQRLLGHADQRMTQRVYSHMLDKTLAKAVRRNLPSFGLERGNVRKLRP